jgi:ribosomal protein L27
MLFPMLAPRRAFNFMFGEEADGPLGELLTRNWGQMIFATSNIGDKSDEKSKSFYTNYFGSVRFFGARGNRSGPVAVLRREPRG